jgi:hypothetical protein
MGKDIEIVAYRGEPASIANLADLISRFTPYADFFRHSVASSVEAPPAPDLHCIAFYDRVSGAREHDDEDDDEERETDKDEAPRKASSSLGLYFPQSKLDAMKDAAASGASLSSIVQQAWRSVHEAHDSRRPSAPSATPVEPDAPGLVCELSRICGEAFLVGYGDHSCTAIYAHFRHGELVNPKTLDEVYAEHDDYTSWPARQWSAALGEKVEIDGIAARYFPETGAPPLYECDEPTKPIEFDSDYYVMGLSESM